MSLFKKRFQRFMSHYRPDGQAPSGEAPDLPGSLSATGFDEPMSQYAGCTFDRGLYRLHTQASSVLANGWVAEAFPEFAHRVHCFGFDWSGDQFALDRARTHKGENLVLLLEAGTAEALEIPATFAAFHDQELVDEGEAALSISFWQEWLAANPGQVPLRFADCVGYKVPLFLGGEDTVENLEVIDVDVYWTITGQLRRQVEQI